MRFFNSSKIEDHVFASFPVVCELSSLVEVLFYSKNGICSPKTRLGNNSQHVSWIYFHIAQNILRHTINSCISSVHSSFRNTRSRHSLLTNWRWTGNSSINYGDLNENNSWKKFKETYLTFSGCFKTTAK